MDDTCFEMEKLLRPQGFSTTGKAQARSSAHDIRQMPILVFKFKLNTQAALA